MTQLGFVIDHARCIGCHACTVACKAENDVPVGSFRTWVKYVEEGTFPQVKRSFAVLRCNQCTDAPCVTICPVRALEKRPDGIVDLDASVCIGCKACLQGCPYDALYLDDRAGTAAKCHFCAHRVEVGLAPACAIVCPTEAIIPGDFDDPGSRVSLLAASGELSVRKPEAGTGPNVRYREVASSAIEPLAATPVGGYLWANRTPGADHATEAFLAAAETRARSVYDVDHAPLWGSKVTAYLFTKSIAAGVVLAAALAALGTGLGWQLPADLALGAPALALLFLALTTVLLVADLKRPERFLSILTRPNWSSWLARGSVVLMAYGLLATLLFVTGLVRGRGLLIGALLAATGVCAVATASYTAWLFGQAKGRVLWMRRGLALELAVHALIGGAGLLLLGAPLLGLGPGTSLGLRAVLAGALGAHVLLVLSEGARSPRGRETEYRRAVELMTRGPFAERHWVLGVGVGSALPLGLLLVTGPSLAWSLAGGLALVGLWVEEDLLVRAGQALPIS